MILKSKYINLKLTERNMKGYQSNPLDVAASTFYHSELIVGGLDGLGRSNQVVSFQTNPQS